MNDPEKDSFTLISGFYWQDVFKPSFIGRLQTRTTQIFGVGNRKKTYDKTKLKLIIVPVEKSESTEQTESIQSFAKIVSEYIESHQPTPDEIERLKEIPPDDIKQMVKAWWDEFIVGGITDDSN